MRSIVLVGLLLSTLTAKACDVRRFFRTPVPGTGGNTLLGHIGSRLCFGNWVLFLNYRYALSRSRSALMVPTRDRFHLGGAYNLFKN